MAHTKNGTSPAARSASIAAASASGRMAKRVVVGDDAHPVGADAGDAQALLDAGVGLRRGVGDEARRVAVGLTAPPVARQRAARIATSVASLAEPWITPPPSGLSLRKRSGRPSSSTIQSSTSDSSSVQAGDVTQLMPCTPSPAASSSPRIDAYDVFDGK